MHVKAVASFSHTIKRKSYTLYKKREEKNQKKMTHHYYTVF